MLLHYDRPGAFSGAECDAILARAAGQALEPATVWSGTADHVDPRTRHAERCHWLRDAATAWLFDRLDMLFVEAAGRFALEVDPMFEPLQIVRYPVGGHFQAWHSDAGADRFWQRQVSLSVELSDPAEHDGGVLEIAPHAMGARTLPRGGARIFLSRAIHRVTPVTRGERWALVAWTGLAETTPDK